jgi:hypothetical protein
MDQRVFEAKRSKTQRDVVEIGRVVNPGEETGAVTGIHLLDGLRDTGSGFGGRGGGRGMVMVVVVMNKSGGRRRRVLDGETVERSWLDGRRDGRDGRVALEGGERVVTELGSDGCKGAILLGRSSGGGGDWHWQHDRLAPGQALLSGKGVAVLFRRARVRID